MSSCIVRIEDLKTGDPCPVSGAAVGGLNVGVIGGSGGFGACGIVVGGLISPVGKLGGKPIPVGDGAGGTLICGLNGLVPVGL